MKITRDTSQLCLLRISSPWPELAGGLEVEFPEWTVWGQDSFFFNRRGWHGLNQFAGPLEWQMSDNGSSGEFTCDYESGPTLHGKIEIENDRRIELSLKIENNSPQKLTSLKFCVCVMTKIHGFDQQNHSQTLIYTSGKPMPLDQLSLISGQSEYPELLHFYFKDYPFRGVEGAYHSEATGGKGTDPYGLRELSDLPCVIRKSGLGHKYIGVAWTHPGFGVANRTHPCMHVNPVLPDVEPGQSADARGWIVFGEGNLAQFKDQQAEILDQIKA